MIDPRFAAVAAASMLSAACIMPAVAAAPLSDACVSQMIDKRVTVVVPNRAGGGYDTYGRTFAPVFAKHSGANVDVVNISGGGGLLAYLRVAEQGPDAVLILIESLGDLIAGTDGSDSVAVSSDDFSVLGIAHTESEAWITSPDIDLASPELGPLVASASSIQSSIVSIGFIAKALNLDIRVVGGYDGSGETTAAILRGEADMASHSLGTTVRRSQGNDLKSALVFADRPNQLAPDAYHLIGPGGLVELLFADKPEQERQAAEDMAQTAVSLSTLYRGLVTAASVDAELLGCLRGAADLALSDPEFATAAKEQGREVTPTLSAPSQAVFDNVRKAFAEAADLFPEVVEDISR